MTDLRSFTLASRQITLDRAATAELPQLFERKKQRLLASPHAFLRGSAPLFYEILAARADLAAGPDGEGFLIGDAHLENVGAYRTDLDEVVFDLNDFDDAAIGPWRLDALRLTTSVLLAARGLGLDAKTSSTLGETLLEAHVAAASRGSSAPMPPMPHAIDRLIATARDRSKADLLDARCPGHKGKRHFERGERYIDLTPQIQAIVPDLAHAYVAALGDRAPVKAKDWEVEDAAQRIAGTGSLGCRRIAIVVKTSSGDDRIVELKEAFASSTEALIGPPRADLAIPSDRVVAAARGMLRSPPRLLASVSKTALGRSFIGRTLAPQEDKLDMTSAKTQSELIDIVRMVGHLVGAGHARGVTRPPSTPWSAADLAALLDHATELAGMMEGVYLAYGRLVEDRPAWVSRTRPS